MAVIKIYGWNGSADELAHVLQNGIKVNSAEWNGKGTYLNVDYDVPVAKKVGKPPKYTTEQLQAMYDAYMDTEMTMSEIAEKYACSRPYVSKVVNRIAREKGIDLEKERAKYYGKVKGDSQTN